MSTVKNCRIEFKVREGETVFHLLNEARAKSGHYTLLFNALVNGINEQHRDEGKAFLGELLKQPDNEGEPALVCAPNRESIELLLSNGADLSFPSGATIFHYYARQKSEDAFHELVTAIEKTYGKEKAQEKLHELLNKNDVRGKTPIDWAHSYRQQLFAGQFGSYYAYPAKGVQDYISMLEKHGAIIPTDVRLTLKSPHYY